MTTDLLIQDLRRRAEAVVNGVVRFNEQHGIRGLPNCTREQFIEWKAADEIERLQREVAELKHERLDMVRKARAAGVEVVEA